MSECADGVYLVDVGVRRAGYVITAIGTALLAGGAGVSLALGEYAVAPFPVAAGLTAIGGGAHLLRVPSSGAEISVDEEAVRLRRGGREIRIAWSEIDRWGIANRRAFGATSRFTQLLLWPGEATTAEARAAARQLWRADRAAWALTTYDPPAELLAAFERVAPRPRRDALVESDW